MTDLDWKYYQNKDFMTRLGHTVTPDAVKAENYDVIYFAGGHGTIWDFKDNEDLQKLTQEIYENNDVVASVCHGAIGLLNVKDAEGKHIIDGKTVTGFSNSEEQAAGLADVVPYLTEDELKIVVQTMNKVITGLSLQSLMVALLLAKIHNLVKP